MKDINNLIRNYQKYSNFQYYKINHGFWERCLKVLDLKNKTEDDLLKLEKDFGPKGFFVSGFYNEILKMLSNAAKKCDKNFFIGLELSGWPDDNRWTDTPKNPTNVKKLCNRYERKFEKNNVTDGLLLKKGCIDGSIINLFNKISADKKIIIGPWYVKSICKLKQFKDAIFVEIPYRDAIIQRQDILKLIKSKINKHQQTTVLTQCGGALSFYLGVNLTNDFENLRWIDFGQALSINSIDDLNHKHWSTYYKKELQQTYNKLNNKKNTDKIFYPNRIIKTSYQSTKDSNNIIDFVENKSFESNFLSDLLKISKKNNQWSNNGPLWEMLKYNFAKHLNLHEDQAIIPCSNGGIALEMLMSIKEISRGKSLRWAISSFSFSNLGVGRTFDSLILDCDENGIISLDELQKANKSFFNRFDGVIITNPFGAINDFSDIIKWANDNDKELVIDNAGGLRPDVQKFDYQSFSLHHTKPYGFGEGGLALIPKKYEELGQSLIEYGKVGSKNKKFWINNGKISELSCAAILSRLNSFDTWYYRYQMQIQRIDALAKEAGLKPLHLSLNPTPSMSKIYLSQKEIPIGAIKHNYPIPFGKYYKPLKNTQNATNIYKHTLNVPTHPDMAKVDREIILKAFHKIQKSSR